LEQIPITPFLSASELLVSADMITGVQVALCGPPKLYMSDRSQSSRSGGFHMDGVSLLIREHSVWTIYLSIMKEGKRVAQP
jgi:hypothetical protein